MITNIKRNWLVYILLIVITLVVYSRVTEFKFVHYDDLTYVTDNDHVKTGLTPANIRYAFSWTEDGNWIPLTWMSYMLDHDVSAQLYSMEVTDSESPAVYHATNLILHVMNTLLLFIVLSALTGLRWRSAMVAAIFAVHPLHVESVAWVAERKDVLSTFFLLLTLCAYVWYSKRPGVYRYLLVAVAFALGLMAKSMLVTLPVVMLLLDMWPLRRLVGWTGDKKVPGEPLRRLVLEKAPLLVLSLAAAVVAVFAQKHGNAVGSLADYPLGERLANALVSYIVYVGKTIWPTKLACLYPHPHGGLPVWQVAGCSLIFAALTFAAVRVTRKLPYLTVGWLWYVITLLPVIGVVQVGTQAMADRYTYIPMIGLSIAIVWGVSELLAGRRAGSTTFAVVSGLVICCLMVPAYSQMGFWRDDLTLFGHAIEVTSDNATAQFNLANSLVRDGQLDPAIAHFREAIRIDPNKSEAHNNLGGILLSQHETSEAAEHFRIAVRLKPDYPDAHSNLAIVLMDEGKVSEAIAHLKIAHRLKPYDQSITQSLEDAEAVTASHGRQ